MSHMTSTQETVAEAFAARTRAAFEAEECAHVTFPEFLETEWLEGLGEAVIAQLGVMAMQGATMTALEDAIRHGLVIMGAAGIAAGRADAATAIVDLSDIAWDDLPSDVLEDISSPEESTTPGDE